MWCPFIKLRTESLLPPFHCKTSYLWIGRFQFMSGRMCWRWIWHIIRYLDNILKLKCWSVEIPLRNLDIPDLEQVLKYVNLVKSRSTPPGPPTRALPWTHWGPWAAPWPVAENMRILRFALAVHLTHSFTQIQQVFMVNVMSLYQTSYWDNILKLKCWSVEIPLRNLDIPDLESDNFQSGCKII
jgi:hypothetical protein